MSTQIEYDIEGKPIPVNIEEDLRLRRKKLRVFRLDLEWIGANPKMWKLKI